MIFIYVYVSTKVTRFLNYEHIHKAESELLILINNIIYGYYPTNVA